MCVKYGSYTDSVISINKTVMKNVSTQKISLAFQFSSNIQAIKNMTRTVNQHREWILITPRVTGKFDLHNCVNQVLSISRIRTAERKGTYPIL